MTYLRPTDIQLFRIWLSPQYIIPLAKSFHSSPVLGAREAYSVIRTQFRKYAHFIRFREGVRAADLELAGALRAMGFVSNFQTVMPLPVVPWRRTASKIWPTQGAAAMPGLLRLGTSHDQKRTELLLLKALSRVLEESSGLNKAYLQGRVWQRTTGDVLVTFTPAEDTVSSLSICPAQLPVQKLAERLFRTTKRAIKAQKHELAPVAYQLLEEWVTTGFIASPAGMTYSRAARIHLGVAPLATDLNGIPIVVTSGKVENGEIQVVLNVDHRVFDGTAVGELHQSIARHFAELEGGSDESSSGGGQ